MTAGVPQDFVLTPMLSNPMYNGVLGLRMRGKILSIGFADVLTVPVVVKFIASVELHRSETSHVIKSCLPLVESDLGKGI